jgi:hypothetical protein
MLWGTSGLNSHLDIVLGFVFVFLWNLFELPGLSTGWESVWAPLGRPSEKLLILDSLFSFPPPLQWAGRFFNFVAIG